MKNLDTRVKYTKDALQKALLTILKHKPIDRITVKEICQQAQINRGTFYLHYSTPNDLLYEIEQQFIENQLSFFSPYLNDNYQMDHLSSLFQSILNNIELCKIIMGQNGNHKFIERMKKMTRKEVINQWCKEFPDYQREDLDYVFDYVFSGSIDLILNWIDENNNETISAEKLANRLDRLGHYAHLAIKEFK